LLFVPEPGSLIPGDKVPAKDYDLCHVSFFPIFGDSAASEGGAPLGAQQPVMFAPICQSEASCNFKRTFGRGSFAGQAQCNESPFFIAALYYSCGQQSSFNRETHETIVVKNNCGKQNIGAGIRVSVPDAVRPASRRGSKLPVERAASHLTRAFSPTPVH
jgi:hypothetical protein